jgi:hypothetical protein
MSVMKLEARQDRPCPQTDIFVISDHRRVFDGYWRQIGGGVPDGLYPPASHPPIPLRDHLFTAAIEPVTRAVYVGGQ